MGDKYLCFTIFWVVLTFQPSKADELTPCILTALTSNIMKYGAKEATKSQENTGNAKLVHVNSEFDYATVVTFVENMFPLQADSDNNCNVIGVVGDLDFNTAKIIYTLANRSSMSIAVVAAVAPSSFLPVTNLALPNLLDMRPLSHYIESLVGFFDELNWTRIGLITGNSYYYQFAAELLQKRLLQDPQNIVIPSVRITDNKVLQTFQEYETRIIVILTDASTACSLLKEAGELNFKWPEYSLIVLDFEVSRCKAVNMDGVISLQERYSGAGRCNDSCFKEYGSSDFCLYSCDTNILLLYDSLMAVDIAANASNGLDFSTGSFPGTTGCVDIRDNKRLSTVSIEQVVDSSKLEIAYYNSQSELVMFPNTSLSSGTIPRGSTLIVAYRPSVLHVIFVVTGYILCNLFVSVVFILYVYFRKEPEVKATSITVSLCMFLGSYLILLYVPMLLVKDHPTTNLPHLADFYCIILAWLSILGLPQILIMSTLFMKMVRVYLIFFTPHSYKRKLFSDPFLFLYITLMVTPSILLISFWLGSDTFVNAKIDIVKKNHILQLERCLSRNTAVWLGLQMVYIAIIAIALVILAIKSSKLRYKNFRDTKEVNAFAFCVVFITAVSLFYFLFFYTGKPSISNTKAVKITLYICHMTIPVACQMFLFIPKVYPPTKRRFDKDKVKSKI